LAVVNLFLCLPAFYYFGKHTSGGVVLKKILIILTSLCVLFSALLARADQYNLPQEMGEMLEELFSPESIEVTISDGGNFAWIEAKGAIIDKMRVESLKLRAMIETTGGSVRGVDKYDLAKMIMMSQGELTLLEKDVNILFAGVERDSRGFSDLSFNFTPDGFTARGVFTAQLLFTIKIRLQADGVLALRPDGIYVENIKIFTQGVQTPDGLVSMVSDRINPLLSFEKIPFPVEFKEIKMTNEAAVLTGYPKPFEGGRTWNWQNK